MRSVLLALATGVAMTFGALSADAMPANAFDGASAAPEMILVSGGCGPYMHRGPFGGCRPGGGGGFAPTCFMRRTPYGMRRICR